MRMKRSPSIEAHTRAVDVLEEVDKLKCEWSKLTGLRYDDLGPVPLQIGVTAANVPGKFRDGTDFLKISWSA